MSHTSFMIELGDDRCWSIRATPDTQSWVDQFATIMELSADDPGEKRTCPRIFFCPDHSVQDGRVDANRFTASKQDDTLPKAGWTEQDFKAVRRWTHPETGDIICEIGGERDHEINVVRMWTVFYSIYLSMIDVGGLPLHGALIEREGKGMVLAGSGGSGKSTVSRRIPPPWHPSSDDQALIIPDNPKGYRVHPVPTWSDRLWHRSKQTWNLNHHVPLTAIFFLEQAESDEVTPLGQGQAAVRINDSSAEVLRPLWWNGTGEAMRKLKQKIFNNACDLAEVIPVYTLRNSRHGRFWREMEKVIV